MPTLADNRIAELAIMTGLTIQEWRDFISLPAEAQAVAARAYRQANWVTHPGLFDAVLSTLGILVTVAADVSGLAGAATAIAALKAL